MIVIKAKKVVVDDQNYVKVVRIKGVKEAPDLPKEYLTGDRCFVGCNRNGVRYIRFKFNIPQYEGELRCPRLMIEGSFLTWEEYEQCCQELGRGAWRLKRIKAEKATKVPIWKGTETKYY